MHFALDSAIMTRFMNKSVKKPGFESRLKCD